MKSEKREAHPISDYRDTSGKVGARSNRMLSDAALRKVVNENRTKADIQRAIVKLTRGIDGTADVLEALRMKDPHFKGDGNHARNLSIFFSYRDRYREEHAGKKLDKLVVERVPKDHKREEEELTRSISTGQGYGLKPEERRAVELHAMKTAMTYYVHEGYRVTDTHADNPYDYQCARDGKCLYVEVKGTTGNPESVLLTRGEVEHVTKNPGKCALFVLYNVCLDCNGKKPKASGGIKLTFERWELNKKALTPLLYKYNLKKG